MVINLDYFIVSLDQRYATMVTPAGILTVNDAYVHKVFDNPFEKDKVDQRYEYKRIYGRVETCPRGYSDTFVKLKDPGTPAPRAYMGHDAIAEKVRKGYKMGRHNYCPSTFEYEKKTLRDVGARLSVNVGDRVYFDYKVTEPDNMLGTDGGRELYKVRADQVLCTVVDGSLIAQGGWCLVEPNMETWEEITTKSGIVMKSQPQAKYLEGIVRVISPGYNINPGDKILYEVNADWRVKVEGKEYYAIEEEDILGKFVKHENKD